jgi:hypothetical protein
MVLLEIPGKLYSTSSHMKSAKHFSKHLKHYVSNVSPETHRQRFMKRQKNRPKRAVSLMGKKAASPSPSGEPSQRRQEGRGRPNLTAHTSLVPQHVSLVMVLYGFQLLPHAV